MLLRHVSNLPQTRGWEKKISEGPPCVVLATPGMLQVGPSRELLELWAPDPRNGLVITGYSVEGTMARVSTHVFFILVNFFCCVYVYHEYTVFFSPTVVCVISPFEMNLLDIESFRSFINH